MAQRYRSSSRSGSASRGSSGSRGGAGSRGGYGAPKKSNPGPMILAVVLVLGVVALIVALQSGKKNEDPPRRSTAMTGPQTPTPAGDTAPKPHPYPEIPASLKQKAKDLATKARELQAQGEAVYQEGMKARNDGDQDLWQAKLDEASDYFNEIQDLYNELLGEVPTNQYYDEEAVANYYLGAEADIVTKAGSRLSDIRKQRRVHK